MTKTEVEQIVTLYEGGWSIRETARIVGAAYGTVLKHLRLQGISRRPPGGVTHQRLSNDEIQRTVFLYTKVGLNTTEVAEVLGIHRTSVGERLRRAGVQPRPRSEVIRHSYRNGRRTPKG